MQIGAVLPHDEIGTDRGAIKSYLEGLEDLGVNHLLAYDHVLGAERKRPGGFEGPYDKDVAFHEPLTFFAFAAAVTERLGFASTVMILPQRQTALVAKQCAEVAILSGNRLRLGVGIGWNAVEYEALDVPFKQRGARMDEQVELMRRLWSEDVFEHRGRFHTVDNAGINPRPSKLVPIWFGASAPAALKRCGRLGDGWMPLGSPNDTSRQQLEVIKAERTAAGRSMDDFGIQAQAQYSGGSPERWRTHAERWKELGATHLAVATHRAGDTDVDGHLARVTEYLEAVKGV
jgi:probable F420-dependent oxidoreductase